MEKEIALGLIKMKKLLIILVFFIFKAHVNAATLNVPGTYPTIQAALNSALAGDDILVQPGTYMENITWPTTQNLRLISAGDATNTFIDGNNTGRVITFPTGQNYNNSTIIDGFCIQNGYLNATNSYGAAIYAVNCSATFKNLILRNNSIIGATRAYGGGIYFSNSSGAIIDSCEFINNEVNSSFNSHGGALYFTSNSTANITNSTFLDMKGTRVGTSSARCYGGVIYAGSGCNLILTDIEIGNTDIDVSSYIYGGAIYMDGNTSTLTNVVVTNTKTNGNSGRVYGGGIYYEGGGASTWNNITISDQDINATSYIYGGALYLNNSNPTINSSFFTRSYCDNSVSGRVYGGGVYVNGGTASFSKVYMTCNETFSTSYNYGAGFYITNSANVTLTNGLIAHNIITNTGPFTYGAGIYVGSSSTLNAINTTVTENSRNAGTTNGVGLYNTSSTVNLTNCIFWNNYPGNEIAGTACTITYSDIRGGYAGTGNINALPQFVSSGTDYHLQNTSPCIDVATSVGAPTVDLDNNPRPVGAGFDMGAFERQPYTNIDFCPIIILPVEFLNFSSVCNGSNAILIWKTGSEINNDYFVVEKSIDGESFIEIGNVKGAGNSNSLLEYSFVSDEINNQTTYYRLKQVDFNGEYSYSNTIVNKCENKNFDIYPNPATNRLNINLDFTENITLTKAIIYNSIGQIVTEELLISKLNTINIEHLDNGLYHIQLHNDKQLLTTQKFIKQ